MNDLDGYGQPFPPHTQQFHARCVAEFIERCEQDKLVTPPPPEQCDWKEEPAGTWDKSPKDNRSLDG